jgi:uncharacterized membrane protein
MSRRKSRAPGSQPRSTNTIVVPAVAPPTERRASTTTIAKFEAQFFEGPLPPPEIFAKYEEACPGAAMRILAMAETQAQHRQNLETRVIESNCRSQDRGPILGFLLAAFVVCFGFYLILHGKEISGLVALVTALVAMVAPFIYGKHKQLRELEEERERLSSPPSDDWEYSAVPLRDASTPQPPPPTLDKDRPQTSVRVIRRSARGTQPAILATASSRLSTSRPSPPDPGPRRGAGTLRRNTASRRLSDCRDLLE